MLLRRVARPLIAAVFIAGGVDALLNPKGKADAAKPLVDRARPALDRGIEQLPVTPPTDAQSLVQADAVVKIAAGTLLALGWAPRLAATALAASLAPTTMVGHAFWEETDPQEKATQRLHFLKNASMLGGLLLAAADTEGKPSLAYQARTTSRRAQRKAERAAAKAAASVGDTWDSATSQVSDWGHKAADLVPGR